MKTNFVQDPHSHLIQLEIISSILLHGDRSFIFIVIKIVVGHLITLMSKLSLKNMSSNIFLTHFCLNLVICIFLYRTTNQIPGHMPHSFLLRANYYFSINTKLQKVIIVLYQIPWISIYPLVFIL